MKAMITVAQYPYANALGSASFTDVPVFLPQSSIPSATSAFDPKKHSHDIASDLKEQLDRTIAKNFLKSKSASSESRETLSSLEVLAVCDFLNIDHGSFARLLGVSQGVLAALLKDNRRAVSKYISMRCLLILEAELENRGFAAQFAAATATPISTGQSSGEPHSTETVGDSFLPLSAASAA